MTPEPPPPATARDPILIIDDDRGILRCLQRALQDTGRFEALICDNPLEAVTLADAHHPAAILLDLIMPQAPGEEILARLKAQTPEIPVLIVTAMDEIPIAVRCIKAGAYDYLTKPLDVDRLTAAVSRAVEYRRLQQENRELRRRANLPRLKHPECFARIVTQSAGMTALFAAVEAIAPSTEPVLILGETGTGKELIAGALHQAGRRAGRLVSVNVAGLDETAFTDTLFGHIRGAFTGAAAPREGLVQQAAGGTLFLDEIGDLKMEIQAKLLRLVQEREFLQLGSDAILTSHCRLIAATNRDLPRRVRNGQFREDLFYRLSARLFRIPPLRERLDDLPLLLNAFLDEAATALGKPRPTPPRELLTYLAGYAFPGNVRELRAMVFDAVAQHDKGILSLHTFLEHMDRNAAEPATAPATADLLAFGPELPSLDQATHLLLREALRRAKGNQTAAARLLGISRRTMNRYFASGTIAPAPDETTP